MYFSSSVSSKGQCASTSARSSADLVSAKISSFSFLLRAMDPRSDRWAPSPPDRSRRCSGHAADSRPRLSVRHPAPSSRVRLHRRIRLDTATAFREHLPPLRRFYKVNLQRDSLALPRVTRVLEEAAAEYTHGVCQGRVWTSLHSSVFLT
jgi:hypothetical protein